MSRPRFDETDEEFDARIKRRGSYIGYVLLVVLLTFCGMAFFPVWQGSRPQSTRGRALSNVKQLALGTLMYANDFDDHLPHAVAWMDEISPYLGSGMRPDLFHSPAISGAGEFGFAFRLKLSAHQIPKIDKPSETALIFDSTDKRWNANGGLDLLPRPGRYESYNVFAFVDCHAKAFMDDGPSPIK